MEKIKTIEKKLLQARLAKDEVTKNLLVTLKGEYENAIKNGESGNDQLIEKLAKKMTKNAEMIGNDESKKEIEILKEFMPVELSEAEVKNAIKEIMDGAPDKVNNFKLGNKSVVGWFIGALKEKTNGAADPKTAGKLIQEMLQSA